MWIHTPDAAPQPPPKHTTLPYTTLSLTFTCIPAAHNTQIKRTLSYPTHPKHLPHQCLPPHGCTAILEEIHHTPFSHHVSNTLFPFLAMPQPSMLFKLCDACAQVGKICPQHQHPTTLQQHSMAVVSMPTPHPHHHHMATHLATVEDAAALIG